MKEEKMKILVLADVEAPSLWDYYVPGKLDDVDLILSCGDLKPQYLSFLVTLAKCPLFYVHGNHDGIYERKPPEGCICIEDKIVEYKGIRIMGLGGSYDYNGGPHQYDERDMRRRVRKMWWQLRRKKGFDILLTHACAYGVDDEDTYAHRGFEIFTELMDKYKPAYHLHGHVHLNYGRKERITTYEDTLVINGYEKYLLEI